MAGYPFLDKVCIQAYWGCSLIHLRIYAGLCTQGLLGAQPYVGGYKVAFWADFNGY